MSKHDMSGKVVWITGASAGIGAEMARRFVGLGAKVALSARRKERLESLVTELNGSGDVAAAFPCDVTEEEQLFAAVQSIVDHFGKLDVAVANAGFGVAGKLEDLRQADWRRQLDTNVVGAAMTANAALPELRKTRGRLALVGSVVSMLPSPKTGAYTASKYAVRAIGQTYSIELAGSGVTCTTIHPGFVESEIGQVDNAGKFDGSRSDKRPAQLMWKTTDAARVMVDAIVRRKREYVFTAHGKVGAFLGLHFPGLVHQVLSRAK